MPITSFEYIVFTLLAALVFFILPRKARTAWLLAASLVFYGIWSIPNAVLLLVSSLGTYLIGILCEGKADGQDASKPDKRKKRILALGIVLLAGELFAYKYLGFAQEQINSVLSRLNGSAQISPISLIAPVGISFYVFQSIGYMVDVYRGTVRAERNVVRFLLFITFFPKIVQGPIERSDGFLKQIGELDERGRFDYRRVTSGLTVALWGFFMKMVIADRIAIMVDKVFGQYYLYGTVELALAAIGYAIQIYCDFAGYSIIAVGVGRIFGFELIQNFNCPYFSVSTREFWRRWHISLSTWFRDYVYIPLGGSRCSKWRKRLNIMIVMLVSGIWHGAGWRFLAWGFIHGFYQVAGDVLSPKLDALKKRLHMRTESVSYTVGRMIVTTVLITVAWVFFRADNLRVAVDYLRRMLCCFNPWTLFDGSLVKLGLAGNELNLLVVALAMLLLVDTLRYARKAEIDQLIENESLWFKWGFIIVVFTMVWVYGKFGPGFSSANFIYQSF